MIGAYLAQHPGSIPTRKLHLAALRAFFDLLVTRHVVVLNLTRRADGQWRSIENAETFKEQRLMYETYLSELAKGAKDLGYGITIGKHGNPELAHIAREQIEHCFAAPGSYGLVRISLVSVKLVKCGMLLIFATGEVHRDV